MSDIAIHGLNHLPDPFFEWRRERVFQFAFALSLIAHALLIAFVPAMRSVNIDAPSVLNVELQTPVAESARKSVKPAPKLHEERVTEKAETPSLPLTSVPEPLPPLVTPNTRNPEPVRVDLPKLTPRVVESAPVRQLRQSEVLQPEPPRALSDLRPAPRTEVRQDPRAEPRPVTRDEPRIEPRVEIRPEPNVLPHLEPHPAPRVGAATDVRSDVRPEPRPVARLEPHQNDTRVDPVADPRPEPRVAPRVDPSMAVAQPTANTAPPRGETVPATPARAPVIATPTPPSAPVQVAVPKQLPDAAALAREDSLLVSYTQDLKRKVDEQKRYPKRALDAGWQGVTKVRVHLAADGSVMEVGVEEKSEHSVLDDAALKMVKNLKPFPPLPDALRGKERTIIVPIQFRIANS